jgi:hypothetical protein
MINPKRVFQLQPINAIQAEINSLAANLAPIWEPPSACPEPLPAPVASVPPPQPIVPEMLRAGGNQEKKFTRPTKNIVRTLMQSIMSIMSIAK